MKKWWVGGMVLLFIAGAGTGFILLKPKIDISIELPSKTTTPKTTPAIVSSKDWKDPAGFTFSYPEDLVLDKHDEDQENYAHIEMTHHSHQGSLIVWAKDPPKNKKGALIENISEWLSGETQFAGANSLDTTLDSQPAKKILITTDKKMIYTASIYDEMLVIIETSLEDSEYWTSVHDDIADTFTFITPFDADVGVVVNSGSDTSASQDDFGTDVVIDEEEVIE
ncbi:hypothetical protein HY408_00715 [Candidatus Gottesmanbacteria bacterium]|nr:hypothetical protein [Candidatus Gottesmanbacteria bacterium]